MIGFLLPLFARLGLSQRLSRLLAIGTLILGAALLIGALWLWLDHREQADDRNNQEIGATVQRDKDKGLAIERTVKGNEVRNEVEREGQRGAGNRLYAECVRSNRGATEVCQRYLLPE